MKRTMKWILSCGVCVLTATSFAQYPSPLVPSGREADQTITTRDASESVKFTSSKDLVGANIKDAQGNKLGEIDDLLINPRSGETFASVGVKDGRYAVVPIQAFTVTPARGILQNAEVSLKSKASLESGPTLAKNEWQKLDNASFVQSLYSHYQLEKPSAMGGTSDDSLESSSGHSDHSGDKHNKKPKQE